MSRDYLYCGYCNGCFSNEYFKKCVICDYEFETKCCGYYCDDCDKKCKKKITFYDIDYYLYIHGECVDEFINLDIKKKELLVDNYGELVNK